MGIFKRFVLAVAIVAIGMIFIWFWFNSAVARLGENEKMMMEKNRAAREVAKSQH